jgi:hypothetical protein
VNVLHTLAGGIRAWMVLLAAEGLVLVVSAGLYSGSRLMDSRGQRRHQLAHRAWVDRIAELSLEAKTTAYRLVRFQRVTSGPLWGRRTVYMVTYSNLDGSDESTIEVLPRYIRWVRNLDPRDLYETVSFPDAHYSDSGLWARGVKVLVMSPLNTHGLLPDE